MTSLLRWSHGSEGGSNADFLDRFEAVGTSIQATYAEAALTPRSYLDLLLALTTERPVEFMLVEHEGVDIARAAVFATHAPAGTGALGLYEAQPGSAGDEATASIIHAAVGWAGRHDLRRLYAPVDANTWFRYRFVSSSTDPAPSPFAWEPQQPESYRTRFLAHGFDVAGSYETMGFAFPSDGPYTLEDLIEHTGGGTRVAQDAGFAFERVDARTDMDALLVELHPLCMEAFSENPLFEPIAVELFVAKYRTILDQTPGHLTFIARDGQGRLTGFMFAFPDDGWIVIKTVAVSGTARGRRLSSGLLNAVLAAGARAGLTKVVTALVRADNVSRFLVDPAKMPFVDRWERTYDLLSREVEP